MLLNNEVHVVFTRVVHILCTRVFIYINANKYNNIKYNIIYKIHYIKRFIVIDIANIAFVHNSEHYNIILHDSALFDTQ